MVRSIAKWACKETSTMGNGDTWARWFGSTYDMSGVSGNKIVTCSRRGGAKVTSSQGVSSK